MRAVVLDADGTLSLRDRPRPVAGDECIVRVTAAGICGTVALAGSQGSIETTYTYEPFGATTVSGSPTDNATQFAG